MTSRILIGSALSVLRTLPSQSVHTCITSPPYWGLRAYNLTQWEGGDPGCEHRAKLFKSRKVTDDKQSTSLGSREKTQGPCIKCGAVKVNVSGGIGLEPTFDEHLDNLVAVFREVRRVLRDDGTLWLNYGSVYASQPNGQSVADKKAAGKDDRAFRDKPINNIQGGWKPKDLIMMPAFVAEALRADGWWLRSEIVWHKKNPMPESVTDRPTCAHEKIFLMSKQPHYFYDAEAVRVDAEYGRSSKFRTGGAYGAPDKGSCKPGDGGSANLRNVWTMATHSYSEAHFATFPPKLVEPCIKAGTSEKGCCAECGAPWVRVVDVEDKNGRLGVGYHNHDDDLGQGQRGVPGGDGAPTRKTTGWKSTCECDAPTHPCVVLDCFAGAGTVGLVAERMYRDSMLIEISKEYATMARDRIYNDAPLLTDVQTEEL